LLDASGDYVGRDRPLTLDEILAGLLEDGLVTRAQTERLRFATRQTGQAAFDHPLIPVSAQNWLSADPPHAPLDLERLTRWLAGRTGLPYARIDPLRVDVASVTNVIKQAYATRFSVLPLAVEEHLVTIATAEPFIREWEHELGEVHKLRFRRVLVNPVALRRYLREFYAISRTLAGASATQAPVLSNGGNLEQLLDLNRLGEFDANDQHIVRLVDWLLQYAFD